MMWTVALLAVAAALLALYLRQVYTKLSRLGINHRPVVPLFGNLFWIFLKKEHVLDNLMNTIKAFPDDRIVGHYELLNPVLLINDVDTMKRITVKDFEHFVDRRSFTSQHDKLFARGLLMLKGEEWKAMRSTLSPAFTSSKIRLMVPFMVEVGQAMMSMLKQRIKESGKPYIDVETREMAGRYATDVIASCAFGLKVDSHTDVDNQFYVNTKRITNLTVREVFKISFSRSFPKLAKMLKVSLASPEMADFFTDLVLSTMKNRELNHIVRNDMINILMEVKKGQLTHDRSAEDANAGFATVEESPITKKNQNYEWTDIDLVAQAMIFLFAGFSTISVTMSFLLHELAGDPDVQDRLVQEIREHDAKNGGKLDYGSIQTMTYLDMVVSEGLRLWPTSPFLDRRCVKDYNIGRPNSKATEDLIIRKDQVIMCPVWAFHRNPEFFPEPKKFDPERFSPANRDKIKPFTYMPFGVGPRNCIGSRLALCEIKVMLYQILREMEVYPFEKTCLPTQLSKEDGFKMTISGGPWVRFRVRPET